MNSKTFINKFDLLVNAPSAVEHLRTLILRLAMRGKIAPQVRQDGNAFELLEEIIHRSSKEADRQNRAKRSDRQSDIVAPHTLPPTWSWTTLGTIAHWGSGSTPPREDYSLYNGTLTWLKSGELNDCRSLRGSTEKVSESALASGSFRRNKPGDVLFAMYGATVGKVAILAEPAVTNQAVCGCTPFQGVLNYFLFYYLLSQRQNFRDASEGGAQPNFSKDKILTYPFPLPPLAEQKRIVAKVDELMALCDQLEAQQQERESRHASLARASLARFADEPTPASLQYLFHPSYTITPADLRKAVLTLAVKGLLVRTEEKKAPWKLKPLKALTTKIGSGSTPSGGRESYQETGVPLIRSMNVHFGGFVYEGLAFLNDDQAEKLQNVTVMANDVLLNITGASIGRVTTAPKDMEGARVNQHVCIIRPTSEIIPAFLELFLASPVVQNLIDNIQVGATREALTKSMIEQFETPVPSPAEQSRIVTKVAQLMSMVDDLETQLANSQAMAVNLLSAVVAELANPE